MGAEIYDAVVQGNLGKVKNLLANKPELVNIKDSEWKWTPLFWAAQKGHKDVVELLIAKGADVNAKGEYGNTPLHRATSRKEIAELLIANGADINARDYEGDTPLDIALRKGNEDVAELLRKHGAVE